MKCFEIIGCRDAELFFESFKQQATQLLIKNLTKSIVMFDAISLTYIKLKYNGAVNKTNLYSIEQC